MISYFRASFVCLIIYTISYAQTYIVAVTPFEVIGKTEQTDMLGFGIPQAIANDLSSLPDIQVVERLQLSIVLQELKLQQTGIVNAQNAVSVGELLGATLIVIGSVQDIQGMVRIHTRVVQTATGEVLFSVKGEHELKTMDDYFFLEDRITKGILLQLGFQIAEAELESIKQKVTDSEDAFQAYSNALKHFDAGDFDIGFSEIEKAKKEDPQFDWPEDIRFRAQNAFEELEREVQKNKN